MKTALLHEVKLHFVFPVLILRRIRSCVCCLGGADFFCVNYINVGGVFRRWLQMRWFKN